MWAQRLRLQGVQQHIVFVVNGWAPGALGTPGTPKQEVPQVIHSPVARHAFSHILPIWRGSTSQNFMAGMTAMTAMAPQASGVHTNSRHDELWKKVKVATACINVEGGRIVVDLAAGCHNLHVIVPVVLFRCMLLENHLSRLAIQGSVPGW